ncbi:hypothetical protein [Hirschia baltica]|uniref:Ribbon-helix-helix protein RHH domain-containing protein n=1 Tax=Hirschia baltica (strain ATCC 49814 / DSM 5838 / IFAM 1418) TaxID=582402 RepID=C6XLD1_HIRBI|nr:hypothetical protein [Hirschia baltica]ACT59730.1 hypothetical protein Hbal_2047 [Hirschia baltica ATCC 49814]
MPHHKKKHKKVKKDSQLVLRVNKDERDAFVELCEEMDTSASREIRRFMKEFILEHTEEDEVEIVASPPKDEADS